VLAAVLLGLRKMIHSTSLRAAGSEIVASTWVALSAPLLRRQSIARLTSATSAAEAAGAGASANGSVSGWSASSRASREPDALADVLAGAEASDESQRARRGGSAAAAALWDFFSPDLAVAAFFPVDFAVSFAVAAGRLPVPL
jgi:hypothetical protein